MATYTYKYPRPNVTATVVVQRRLSGAVLLGRRSEASDAFPGEWCLPGGFINTDESPTGPETIEDCAVREILEETGIDFPKEELRLIGVYSTPGTDPRGHVINVAYLALVPDDVEVFAGDDIEYADFFDLAEALGRELAFDHAKILNDSQRLWG